MTNEKNKKALELYTSVKDKMRIDENGYYILKEYGESLVDEYFWHLVKDFNEDYLDNDETITGFLYDWNSGKTDSEEGFINFCEEIDIEFEVGRAYGNIPYLVALTILKAYIAQIPFELIEEEEDLESYFYLGGEC